MIGDDRRREAGFVWLQDLVRRRHSDGFQVKSLPEPNCHLNHKAPESQTLGDAVPLLLRYERM
jgi:hypothetical protein